MYEPRRVGLRQPLARLSHVAHGFGGGSRLESRSTSDNARPWINSMAMK